MVKAVRAPLRPAFLRSVLAAAAEHPAVLAALPADPSLTVRITGDRELRRLNRAFLGTDHTTDVVSFPDGGGGYLGDLALSWPAVSRQASGFGHPQAVEAALLSVHGLLHLLGWDHAATAREAEMTALTLACLARSSISPAAGRL